MKNILYYEPSSGYGGSSNSLSQLLVYLDRGKYNPFVILHYSGPQFNKIEDMGIRVYRFSRFEVDRMANQKGLKVHLNQLINLFGGDLPLVLKFMRFMMREKIAHKYYF
jgi:hypothetical protein